MVDPFERRLEKLRKKLAGLGVDAFLTFTPANRRYLSGFTGTSGYVVVTQDQAVFLTDSRYTEQARAQCPAFTVVDHGNTFWDSLAQQLAKLGARRLGFEKRHLTVGWLEDAQRKVPGVEWIGTEAVVEELRLVKDDGEIARIRRAQELADELFAQLVAELRPGMTELQVAHKLLMGALAAGASGMSFETIVASGWRSALPHGTASDKVIEAGDLVTIDFGCVLDGYVSDMTRTVVMGTATERQREIYQLVLKAQEAGIEAIRAGRSGREVDAIARAVIQEAGFGDNFGHGLGHGVGLEIHEEPRLSPLGRHVLEPGMVVTVEPGVYIPGWGGVRIEDLIVVGDDGPINLTRTPKHLMEL